MAFMIKQAHLEETPLNISDLTTTHLTGNGVFDVMMQTFANHLMREYSAERITGNSYATAYIEGLQAVLAASVQFTLEKEKQALELRNLDLQGTQIETQTAKLLAEIEMMPIELAIAEQKLEIAKQQLLQSAAEAALVAQKVITEKAQTDGSVIGEGSHLGLQNDILKVQAEGFIREAEYKIAKLMSDAWAIRRNTDDAEDANNINKLDNDNIGKAMQKAFDGIGIV